MHLQVEQQQLERSDAARPQSTTVHAGAEARPLLRCVREALEAPPQAGRGAPSLLLPSPLDTLPSPQPTEREQQGLRQLRSLSLGGRRRRPVRNLLAAIAAAKAAAEAVAKAAATAAEVAAKAATAAAKAAAAKADAAAAKAATVAAKAAAVAAQPRAERLPRGVRPAGYPPLVRGAKQLEREGREVHWLGLGLGSGIGVG